jgi:pyruvate, orthophosphate dikinase
MESRTSQYIHAFDAPREVPGEELTRLIGGKGASLRVMASELRLPVPPGFTITTAACRAYLDGRWPVELDAELRAHMTRLGRRVGRRFGHPEDPLLVSVRSGAPVSMPGMMDTILNLGLNQAIAAGLGAVTGDPGFAADCLRRFREGYRALIGVEEVPDDPWLQLRSAIEAVFRSWHSDRARAYRRRERIPDDLGTAVTVQAMVFGNRGADSGTGVLFTRNPSTGERELYGDVMFNVQGEEVVAGGHRPQPLSVLEERLPRVAAELRRDADLLERHYRDLCDVEFTIELGRLWLLQARVGKRSPRAALRIAIEMAEDPGFPCSRDEAVRRVAHLLADPPQIFIREADVRAPIASGLPASPGVATGGVVTSSDAAEAAAAAGRPAILVRVETSPEDVRGIACSAGVLTARGGLASHAAVVARGWGIPAVVGASDVQPADDSVRIDGRTFRIGDEITIDGGSGEIYAGRLVGRWEAAPEAATLRSWAAELGIAIGSADARAVDDEDEHRQARAEADLYPQTSAVGALSPDDLLRTLAVKGAVSPEQLSDSLRGLPRHVERLIDGLVESGLAERAGEAIHLSAEGKLEAGELFAADRDTIGGPRCVELLESFHAFDQRMKRIVTAWQMRGAELNDHTDAAYDARLLDDLATLHATTGEWLGPLCALLPRFAIYRSRLQRAVDLSRGGDQRYVASPRVDSYHGVWFELHEDLIRLAGRRRSDTESA